MDHAPFHIARHPFLFFLQAAGKHNIGVPRRLGKEEIDDAKKLQPVQRFARVGSLRQGDKRIEADRDQRLDLGVPLSCTADDHAAIRMTD